jgi:hypothetical protein
MRASDGRLAGQRGRQLGSEARVPKPGRRAGAGHPEQAGGCCRPAAGAPPRAQLRAWGPHHCPQAFEAAADAIKTATQVKGTVMPLAATKPTVQMVKITAEMKVSAARG